MTTQVIFPTEIANGTPATDDRILFSDTSASNATKDCAISELPNSDATVASLALKVDKTTTVNGHALSGNVTVTASDVGLGNVDNTSDASKPVSTAQQTAIDAKVSDTVYGVDWDGVTTIAPSKNAVYDKIETIVSGLTSGTVTSVSSANADIGVATGTTTPVLTLNSGTGANQIVKLNGSAQLPAVDGSLLTNLPSSGHTIQDAGTPLTQRTNLNFASDVFIVTDDAGNNATKVEISSIPLPSYTLSNVTTNRTLDADAITGNELADVVGTLINDIDILSTGGVTSVNGEGGAVTLTSDDISDTAQTHKFVTAADITKLSNLSGTNTGDQTNITGNAGTVTNGVYTTDAGTVFLAPNGSAAALTSFPTLNQDTTGTSAKTNALNSATTVVNVSSATAPSSGQVLTATSSTAATWQTPSTGSFAWGATANGGTGTGVALSMDDSYASGGIGQSITIGNTQSNTVNGLVINTGTSNSGLTSGFLVNSTAGVGGGLFGGSVDVAFRCYTSATQALSNEGLILAIGNNYNTNSSISSTRIQVTNEDNASTGINTGLSITNKYTAFNGSGAGVGMNIRQEGVAGTAFGITTGNSVNTTNGLINVTLANTQSGATVVQKIDTGTSSQAHTGLLIHLYNASTTSTGINILQSTTGTGYGIQMTGAANSTGTFAMFNNGTIDSYIFRNYSSNTEGVQQAFSTDLILQNSTFTSRTLDFFKVGFARNSEKTSGTIADNFNLGYLKRTNRTLGAGGTLTAAGSVLKLENVATQTAGTLTDTVTILDLNQGVTTSGTMIKMTCGNTNSAAFDFATNLTTATAPAGASTYINIKVNGVAYRMLAQAVV